MLVFSAKSLAYLAVPKTGTTAVELALKRRADIIFSGRRKHLTAQQFHNKISPFLRDTFRVELERVAVIRNPVDQIRSWYRYRQRSDRQTTALSTQGCSFDEFVLASISDTPPPYASLGSQYSFLTSGNLQTDGTVLVHHLFSYEEQPRFRAFLNMRLDSEIVLKPQNVSPYTPAPISPEVEAKLRAHRAREFALFDQVQEAGGHLITKVPT